MVKELRKIILGRDDFVTALEGYKRTNFEFLPAGRIVNCTLQANAPVAVGIETISGNTIQAAEFIFKPPDLLEPLIKFCIEHNIMLPRNSRKSVLVGEDQVVLFIQINTADAM